MCYALAMPGSHGFLRKETVLSASELREASRERGETHSNGQKMTWGAFMIECVIALPRRLQWPVNFHGPAAVFYVQGILAVVCKTAPLISFASQQLES